MNTAAFPELCQRRIRTIRVTVDAVFVSRQTLVCGLFLFCFFFIANVSELLFNV